MDVRRICRYSALVGGTVWVVWLARSGFAPEAESIIAAALRLAFLVTVPLGLAVSPAAAEPTGMPARVAAILQLPAGLLAAFSLDLARGPTAAALVIPWLVVTAGVAITGLDAVLRHGRHELGELCGYAGLAYLGIGGGALVMSRLGLTPFGFGHTIVALTAVHFHYAGFATPLLTARVARLVPPSRTLGGIVAGVVGGPALVGAGITFAPALELVAALMLTASVVGLGAVVLCRVVSTRAVAVDSRLLLAISAAASLFPMLCAATYAFGEFFERNLLTIPEMLRLHGIANALGFTLCGLLGWTLHDLRQAGANR